MLSESYSPVSTSPPHKTDSLETCIRHRHSTRSFLSTPLSESILYSALQLAQLSPSNSNIQNWRLYLCTTPASVSRLKSALLTTAQQHGPNIPALPGAFAHFRSELGVEVYGQGLHIARGDRQGREKAVLKNYEFFGAPVVGVVCMDRTLSPVDAISVGVWLQTLILALTEQGVGTCVEVSVASYPDVLRRELGIGDDMLILCGLAIGYPDENNEVNHLTVSREAVDRCVLVVE